MPSIEFTMGPTVPCTAGARMGLGFETVGTCSSIGAENVSISAPNSTFHLAVLANIRDSLVLCVIAVAEHQWLIDGFVESLNTLAPVIAEMSVATILIRPIAPQSCHVIWTVAMPSILARLLEEEKGNAIAIGGVLGKVCRAASTG